MSLLDDFDEYDGGDDSAGGYDYDDDKVRALWLLFFFLARGRLSICLFVLVTLYLAQLQVPEWSVAREAKPTPANNTPIFRLLKQDWVPHKDHVRSC